MKNLKHRLFTNWNYVRVLYTALGLLILFSSIPDLEWIGVLFGAYVSSMGLFAFGCASGYCYPMKNINKNKLSSTNELEVQFEEITNNRK